MLNTNWLGNWRSQTGNFVARQSGARKLLNFVACLTSALEDICVISHTHTTASASEVSLLPLLVCEQLAIISAAGHELYRHFKHALKDLRLACSRPLHILTNPTLCLLTYAKPVGNSVNGDDRQLCASLSDLKLHRCSLDVC